MPIPTIYNESMSVANGDRFIERNQSDNDDRCVFEVMDAAPAEGRFAVRILTGDGELRAYSAVDVTDARIFIRDVERPELPELPGGKFLYLFDNGHVNFGGKIPNAEVIAKHDVSEGTWRYLDGEIIPELGWS